MTRTVRSYLIGVLVLDAATVAFFFGAPLLAQVTPSALPATVAGAVAGAVATPSSDEAVAPPAERDALLNLGRALAARQAELERREAEIAEMIRSEEVLLRARGLEGAQAPPPAADTDRTDPDVEAFERLGKAYENMEPDSAALALAELAALDREAVLQLLAVWPPRTSGAILDSLTQNRPDVAAELTYEMWKRGGKVPPSAASSGR